MINYNSKATPKEQETTPKEQLESQSFSTDRAMDESYNKNKEKTKQQLSNEDIEVLLSDNQEYFQHKSRVSTLQSNLKNHTPYRFAFNSIAVKKLKSDNTLLGDSQRLFARRGIRPSLVAQTVEPDSERFFSDYNLLSNSSIMVDNYDFFLNNIDNIRVNLARVMLAKRFFTNSKTD